MATIEVTASAILTAAPEQAWELLCDTKRYAEWVEATEKVTQTDGPARLGSTYGEVNPILGPWKAKTTWTVIEFESPRRQVHRTEDIPIAQELLVIMEVAPAGEASEVTIRLRSTSSLGPLGAGLFAVLKPQTRRDNERTVRNLAELTRRELTT